jgi:ribonuclease HII
MTLKLSIQKKLLEAGCDEAGRGCLVGDVYAAAVILPPKFKNALLNDSKQLSETHRDQLRLIIEKEALAWAVGICTVEEIDTINILNASIKAMHRALEQLQPQAEYIAVDGNRFKPYKTIPHQTIIKGDGTYMNIAAASILAKTHRDEYMKKIADEYPQFNWQKNKGYGTKAHRELLIAEGATPYHRKSFKLKETQLTIFK